MTNQQQDIIRQLSVKIERLIAVHEGLREENQLLKDANEKLAQKVKEQQESLLAYEQNGTNLNLATPVDNLSSDKHETKLKINRLVREIDKCIALLNK